MTARPPLHDASPEAVAAPDPDVSPSPRTGPDVAALAPAPPTRIRSRGRLPRTRLVDDHRILEVREPSERERPSLATRRYAARRRRLRKRLLIALALVLAVFPPMWAVYLIGWLVWRSRPRQQSMRRVRQAVRALEKSQPGVALKHLQEAHLLDPANSDALYWLGLLLSRQHRHEEAAEALTIVSERVPGLPEVEAALAEAHVAMGSPEGAVYHAQRLFDLDPYAPDSLLALADAYEASGRLDLALQALEQAPLHKPTLNDGLVRIHYRLGTLRERQGDPEGALRHFKRIYAHDATYRDVRARVRALEAAP